MARLRLFLACMAGVFSFVAQAAPLSEQPERAIYQVYVRAFYDGSLTPDGEGDLAGVLAKVDYLKDLGVDTLLLMPVFYSTGDMGYIPRDYFRLDPAYGTKESFREFTTTMHSHGFKIILDAPVNHISYDSEWFYRGSQKRCQPSDSAYDPADPDNQYCDFFYFVDNPCQTAPYSAWHKPWRYSETDCTAVWFPRPDYDSAYHRQEQVYATFFSVMPDLKFWDFERQAWNEPVVQEVERFFKEWTALGVDGFRIDAAKHFVEGETTNANAQEPRNKELLARFLRTARSVNPDVSFLGEIWAPHSEFEPYLGEALDMVLDFPFMEAVRGSVASHYGQRLKEVLQHFENKQDVIPAGQRVVFAGNHDVSRMMTEWPDDEVRLRMAHFASLLTPFTPLLYYAEEIGSYGKVKRPDNTSDEEYVRTIKAFPWHGRDASVGFPGGKDPVVGIPENSAQRNLETLAADPSSTFHLVKTLLQVRRDFGVSTDTQLKVRSDLYGHVIGWTMVNASASGTECLTMIANFDRTQTYVVPGHHADSRCPATSSLIFEEGAAAVANGIELQGMGKAVVF